MDTGRTIVPPHVLRVLRVLRCARWSIAHVLIIEHRRRTVQSKCKLLSIHWWKIRALSRSCLAASAAADSGSEYFTRTNMADKSKEKIKDKEPKPPSLFHDVVSDEKTALLALLSLAAASSPSPSFRRWARSILQTITTDVFEMPEVESRSFMPFIDMADEQDSNESRLAFLRQLPVHAHGFVGHLPRDQREKLLGHLILQLVTLHSWDARARTLLFLTARLMRVPWLRVAVLEDKLAVGLAVALKTDQAAAKYALCNHSRDMRS